MRWFRILFAFDAVVAAVLLLVFGVGLLDAIAARHADTEDLLLWPPLLLGLAAVLWASLRLRSRGRLAAARLVLLIVAVPGLIGALVLLAIAVTLMQPGAWR